MKPIGVAIVGCGRISDLHEIGYRDCEDASIVALCDSRRERARKCAKTWGVGTVYDDYQQVLDDPDVDLVELLVPHNLHAAMTVAACRAGKHVSVQKPMAMNTAEADQMIAAAQAAGVLLRIYENFVFYPPHVKAKEMIEDGVIGEPQMIRMHVSTGKSSTEWKIPPASWLWRLKDEKDSGGLLVFDHGYHLFSLAYHLMGQIERVYAWIDHTPAGSSIPERFVKVDAPATIMFQFKTPHRYGMLDFANTPNLVMESIYYSDDDRVEVIGDKGIIIINRCTARTLDLPPLMLFTNGITSEVPIDRFEWQYSFIDCTRQLINVIKSGGEPILNGATGKKILQFALAAQISSNQSREVRPDEV